MAERATKYHELVAQVVLERKQFRVHYWVMDPQKAWF